MERKTAEIEKKSKVRVRMRVPKGTAVRKGRKEMAGIVDFGGVLRDAEGVERSAGRQLITFWSPECFQ